MEKPLDYWYNEVTDFSDVLISGRIRLARNIQEFKFPNKLNLNERNRIINKIRDVLMNVNFGEGKKLDFINMSDIPAIQALSMAERHLISYDMANNPKGRAVFCSQDRSISIMINEEDHLRLQFFNSGLNIHDIYGQAQEIDKFLDERLTYAFDEDLGYLTECITNIGTGMRVSVSLHLLALDRCGVINKISTTLSKMGFTIRGSFGEGSKVKGSFYQISNQITLGLNEDTVIENLKAVIEQIISQERSMRKSLINDINFQDTLMRSYGIIKYAKIINYEEFIELASLIRLGIAEKIIKEVDLKTLNYLINDLGPSTIAYKHGSEISPVKRDIIRAATINQKLLDLC